MNYSAASGGELDWSPVSGDPSHIRTLNEYIIFRG
jgi:hypothetical protein